MIDGRKIPVVSRNKLINDQKCFLNVCFAAIPNNCQIEFPLSNSCPISYFKWLTKGNTLFRYYVSRAFTCQINTKLTYSRTLRIHVVMFTKSLKLWVYVTSGYLLYNLKEVVNPIILQNALFARNAHVLKDMISNKRMHVKEYRQRRLFIKNRSCF